MQTPKYITVEKRFFQAKTKNLQQKQMSSPSRPHPRPSLLTSKTDLSKDFHSPPVKGQTLITRDASSLCQSFLITPTNVHVAKLTNTDPYPFLEVCAFSLNYLLMFIFSCFL